MRIIFVRHGQAVGNARGELQGRRDHPLTQLGRAQAERTAEALSATPGVVALYVSSLTRARQTAEPIGRVLELGAFDVPDLMEADLGLVTGRTWEEASRENPDWAARISARQDGSVIEELWPGGELTSVFRGRCQAAALSIAESLSRSEDAVGNAISHADEVPNGEPTAIVVAHSGSIIWAIAGLLGDSPDNWPSYRLPPASITELRKVGASWVVFRLGETSHLAELSG